MINPNDVTIIVPHFGADKQQCYSLKQCLTSLEETAPEIKRIVVKNGNIPCQCDRDIRIIEQGQNKAVNAAAAMTNTPWIFITNDDMIYAPGWFERLTRFKEGTRDVNLDDNNILCISPQLVEPRPGAPTFLTEFCGGAGGDFNKEKWLDYASKHPISWQGLMPGFNLPLLIYRNLWNTVVGYDINYDPWGSNGDSDLEYKIMLAGVQPYQNTNCVVYHFSQTSGTFEPRNDSYRFKNYGYFKEKWGFDRTDNGIWEASFTIPSKEEGRIFCPEWEGKYD
jgi:hypothetical protein